MMGSRSSVRCRTAMSRRRLALLRKIALDRLLLSTAKDGQSRRYRDSGGRH